jgi:tetratricopeptide (TPR) repeat protein
MDERTRENLARGREHYAAREYGKAEPFLAEIVTETNLEFADVFDMLGVIYHQQGRLGDAEGMFKRALKINPNYTEAALNLAVTCNDLGKYAEAKEIYARALTVSKSAPRQLDPFAKGKIANMHAAVGGAYHDVGQYVDAIREYEKALTLCPTFHDIRTRLGATLRDMGSLVAAAREFERIRHDNPKFLPARVNLGLTYSTRGRRADALAEWQQILDIEPTNKSAAMYIAMVKQMPTQVPGPSTPDGSAGGRGGGGAATPPTDVSTLADLFDPAKPNA